MRSSTRRTSTRAAPLMLLTLAALMLTAVAGAAEPTSPTRAPMAMGTAAMLVGSEEVPPVTTTATASCTIKVGADRTVTGAVTTTGIDGTVAHVHAGARGTNGPPLITLKQISATQWAVPTGSTLTQAQYDSYKQGELYVNIHSAMHPNGEIRLQL